MPTSSRTALRFSRRFAYDVLGNVFDDSVFSFFVRGYRMFRDDVGIVPYGVRRVV